MREYRETSRPMARLRMAAFPTVPYTAAISGDRLTSTRDVALCLKCANTGHSPTPSWTDQIDLERRLALGLRSLRWAASHWIGGVRLKPFLCYSA